MKLNAEDLKKLAEACARYLNPGRLERFVLEARLVEDIEAFKKLHLVGAADVSLALSMAFLELLNEHDLVCDVVEKLYFEMSWSPDFQAAAGPYTRSAQLGEITRLCCSGAIIFCRTKNCHPPSASWARVYAASWVRSMTWACPRPPPAQVSLSVRILC